MSQRHAFFFLGIIDDGNVKEVNVTVSPHKHSTWFFQRWTSPHRGLCPFRFRISAVPLSCEIRYRVFSSKNTMNTIHLDVQRGLARGFQGYVRIFCILTNHVNDHIHLANVFVHYLFNTFDEPYEFFLHEAGSDRVGV